MKTATQIIQELKIEVRHFHDGKQSTKCPECSHTRKKKNAKCLNVTIDHEGVQWYCHHCGWSGGEFYDGQDKEQFKPKCKTLSLNDINHQRRRMG